MKIWYLYHSAFLVELENRVLIFDYFKDKPRRHGLTDGVVNPRELENYQVDVFVSHRHGDHFNRVIFGWHYDIRHIRYFLSPDILAVPEELKSFTVFPDKTTELDNIQVMGLESNDEGVAFLIRIRQATIFFAGDLNWWDWEGESMEYRQKMQESYCKEIDKLAGEKIDIAFIPADPRLGQQYIKGIDYFMRTVGADVCIPIHMDGDYTICENLMKDPLTEPYRDRFVTYSQRGETLQLPPYLEKR